MKHQKLMNWLNFGLNGVDTAINVLGTVAKIRGAKSMSDFMGTNNPFDALEVAGGSSFQEFLAGD